MPGTLTTRRLLTIRRGVTLTDLAIVLACVVLLLAMMPGIVRLTGEKADRVACAANLTKISRALFLYSNDHRGAYPRVRIDTSGSLAQYTGARSAHPFNAADSPAVNDVTAALFLLVRYGHLDPSATVCPSTTDRAWDFGGATRQQVSNFPDDRSLSYSLTNPYPTANAIAVGYRYSAERAAEFALAADENPGADQKLALTSNSPPAALRDGNSRNHGGDGQLVLYGDGHVDWRDTPFAGLHKDNIYTTAATSPQRPGGEPYSYHWSEPPFQQVPAASVAGTDPRAETDSILLPIGTSAMAPSALARLASGELLPWLVVGGILLLLAAVAAVVVLNRRRGKLSPPPPPPAGH